MKHVFLVCLCLFPLFAPFTLAQAEDEGVDLRSNNYAAVATSIVSFEGHFGLADVLGADDDLRFRVSVTPFINFGMAAAVDALFELGSVGTASVYGGGGLSVGVGGIYSSDGLVNTAVIGTIGYEIPLDSVSLIGEFSTGAGYAFGSSGFLYPPLRAIIGLKFTL